MNNIEKSKQLFESKNDAVRKAADWFLLAYKENDMRFLKKRGDTLKTKIAEVFDSLSSTEQSELKRAGYGQSSINNAKMAKIAKAAKKLFK